MKRVFAALLVTSAVALGLGGGSCGVSEYALSIGPSQFLNPYPPQPAPAQPAPAGGQNSGGAANGDARTEPQHWRVELSWKRRSLLSTPAAILLLGMEKTRNITNNALFEARFEKYLNAPASHHAA